MNGIAEKQNGPIQLQRLAAQRQLYSDAKRVIGAQLILGGPIALLFAFAGLAIPELKGYAAFWGITVLVVDFAILSPWQKRLRESGAKIQEAFDCDVLSLTWNDLKVGNKPDPEQVQEKARKYQRSAGNMPSLNNWYPVSVGELPVEWGTIVCQRSNCWWDAQLRRQYATSLMAFLILTVGFSVWYAMAVGLTVGDFVIKIVAPLAPLFSLVLRQFTEHRDAAERLDKLKSHAEKLWKDAMAGSGVAAMKTASRSLQDEIFDGRKRNPPIFDALFRWFRAEQESQMNHGAEHYVLEAKRQLRTNAA